jgi:hypothetical protein
VDVATFADVNDSEDKSTEADTQRAAPGFTAMMALDNALA